MIAFGYAFGNKEQRDEFLLPGIQYSMAEKFGIFEEGKPGENTSIFPLYNRILDRVREIQEMECLVLLHTDVEFRDRELLSKIRASLDPSVAILGAIGTENEGDLKRWERKDIGWAPSPSFAIDNQSLSSLDEKGGQADVAMVDGLLMILSPWSIKNLRFDEQTFHGFHGYDADLCLQARRKGKRVVVRKFELKHHTKGGYTGGYAAFEQANRAFKTKWKL